MNVYKVVVYMQPAPKSSNSLLPAPEVPSCFLLITALLPPQWQPLP